MPKQKKAPRGAFYFYMKDQRSVLEEKGYRFPGGMKDVAGACYSSWKTVTPEEKKKYEELAKEDKELEKFNLHNKFTASGESYAQVAAKKQAMQEIGAHMNEKIDELVTSEGYEKRIYVFIKVIYSCIEDLQQTQDLTGKAYWPLEITIASFNLVDGLKCFYHTLVDTEDTPLGYASAALETSQETNLPIPGSELFRERHKDYFGIMKNIKGFCEAALRQYGDELVIFGMPEDLEPARGCIEWLVNHVEDEKKVEMEKFFERLLFFPLTKLMLNMACHAKMTRNPSYNNIVLVQFRQEHEAVRLLSSSNFDYNDDITCFHHFKEENSSKMSLCTQNVVLRRIYLFLDEIAIRAYNFELVNGHKVEHVNEKKGPPPAKKPQ